MKAVKHSDYKAMHPARNSSYIYSEITFDKARHEPLLQLMLLLVLLLGAEILDESTKDGFIFECRFNLDESQLDGELW